MMKNRYQKNGGINQMDNSCIFWFSGTGNSLHAAKRLSGELGGIPLAQITDEPPADAVGGEGTKIGFVFPSYFGNMPRAVRAFVEKIDIKPDTYIFCAVTMGAVGQGSVGALKNALKAKGLRLNYGRGIVMPANYVLMYNPADPEKSEGKIEKAEKKISGMAAGISSGKQSVRTLPVTAKNLYKNIGSLDAEFKAGDGCTGCGLCEKICPVKNIRLENGRPEWLHHCEHCMGCISWCPAKAIDYGSRTQSRNRYCNPKIKADEMTHDEKTPAV
jgi:ferredoxin